MEVLQKFHVAAQNWRRGEVVALVSAPPLKFGKACVLYFLVRHNVYIFTNPPAMPKVPSHM